MILLVIKVRQNVKLLMLSAFTLKINTKSPSKIQTRSQTCKQNTIRAILTITKKSCNAYMKKHLATGKSAFFHFCIFNPLPYLKSYCTVFETILLKILFPLKLTVVSSIYPQMPFTVWLKYYKDCFYFILNFIQEARITFTAAAEYKARIRVTKRHPKDPLNQTQTYC